MSGSRVSGPAPEPSSDEGPGSRGSAEAAGSPAARAARARRLAEIFGEVLPAQTRDDAAPPEGAEERSREEQLLREVPPHHGG